MAIDKKIILAYALKNAVEHCLIFYMKITYIQLQRGKHD